MKVPESYRRAIPFFIQKSRIDFQKDVYERYDDMVLRQAALHYADQLWGGYPMKAILDFAANYYDDTEVQWIVEVGCGVGRWIAELASRFPRSSCWGIDYSYQMLRQANDFWVLGRDLEMDLSQKGFPDPINAQSSTMKNLHFGLAKASELPFDDNSQDLVINSFVFDRLADPIKSIHEFLRILKGSGKLIMVTPLNFNHANSWDRLYPSFKILALLKEVGFTIIHSEEELLISEPLDAHGNSIQWKCLALVAQKGK